MDPKVYGQTELTEYQRGLESRHEELVARHQRLLSRIREIDAEVDAMIDRHALDADGMREYLSERAKARAEYTDAIEEMDWWFKELRIAESEELDKCLSRAGARPDDPRPPLPPTIAERGIDRLLTEISQPEVK